MTTFSQHYDTTIRGLEQRLTTIIDNGAALDFTRTGDVLTIEFDDGERIVITPQAPMEQLWVSANYAGHRFNWSEQGGTWLNEKSGEQLMHLLSNAMIAKLGDIARLE